MEKTFVRGVINECCKDMDNREKQPSDKPEMKITKCKVCGRRHYRLMAEGAILSSKIHPIM